MASRFLSFRSVAILSNSHNMRGAKAIIVKSTILRRSTDAQAGPFLARSYANDKGKAKGYNLFGGVTPGDEQFKKVWKEEMEKEEPVWTESEDEIDDENDPNRELRSEIRRMKKDAKEKSRKINADDDEELRSIWSDSEDEEKTLWTGSELDSEDEAPTEAQPHDRSDAYLDKLFEFDELPKFKSFGEVLDPANYEKLGEPEEPSAGKKARKLAAENALKKLKKGPDGRWVNVWEVITDVDILIEAFETVISAPEYADLRKGGPKRINMQFFRDLQAKMRNPNFRLPPDLKLKPKSKFVPVKKWQKAESRRRKARKR